MILEALGHDVVAHLDRQLVSARRLLEIVLRQGAAVRRRDVEQVVGALAEIQHEMAVRGQLEAERSQLLSRIAAVLQISPVAVTAEMLAGLLPDAQARAVSERSAELRGLLAEVASEHRVNRALMRQELAFLDHLMRLMGTDAPPAYTRSGATGTATPPPSNLHVLDARA